MFGKGNKKIELQTENIEKHVNASRGVDRFLIQLAHDIAELSQEGLNSDGLVKSPKGHFTRREHRQKGFYVRVVVDIAEQVQKKECHRVIGGRTEDAAVGISYQRSDEGEVNQGGDHRCISALYIPAVIDRNEAFPEDILREEFGLGEKFLMESRKFLVDYVELFRYMVDGKFVKGVHVYLQSGRKLELLPGLFNSRFSFSVSLGRHP